MAEFEGWWDPFTEEEDEIISQGAKRIVDELIPNLPGRTSREIEERLKFMIEANTIARRLQQQPQPLRRFSQRQSEMNEPTAEIEDMRYACYQ